MSAEPTLHEALEAAGWTSEPGPHGGRWVTDAAGSRALMSAREAWAALRGQGCLSP